MDNHIVITSDQIQDMKSCIGFDENKIKGKKHRVMYCYRNTFCTSTNDEKWNDLVKQGLAKKKETVHGNYWYTLTKEGFQFLSKLFGFDRMYEMD